VPEPRLKRPHRNWRQRILLAFMCVLVVLCFGSAAGLSYVQREISAVPRLGLGGVLKETENSGEPQNILMVGIDDGAGLADDDSTLRGRDGLDGSLNTDTIMILRVDPASDRAALLSLPRDLWVTIGGTSKKDKINSALALGGPERLIATIQQNFGVEINHFVMVDFAGFKELVSAVDGVPMYFPWRARDTWTGFVVDEPGCVTLDPDMALNFVRSRHFQIWDEDRQRWEEDPAHDISRTRRQQRFIRAALKRSIAKGVRNPFTANQLIGVGQKNVTLDDQLTTQQVVDLGVQFRDFDPDELDLYTAPTQDRNIGGAAAQVLIDSEAQPIFDIFRGVNHDADYVPSVRVEVRNGSGMSGQGRIALDGLTEQGFVGVRSIDAENFDFTSSVVRYPPGQELAAAHVARFVGGDVEFEEDTTLSSDVNVVLITGSQFTEILDEPEPIDAYRAFLDRTTTTTTELTTPVPSSDGSIAYPEEESFLPEAPPGVSCG
jgi:polyisoprenyl-teichoic acid--peptidoglycan teichoic acid transferase